MRVGSGGKSNVAVSLAFPQQSSWVPLSVGKALPVFEYWCFVLGRGGGKNHHGYLAMMSPTYATPPPPKAGRVALDRTDNKTQR